MQASSTITLCLGLMSGTSMDGIDAALIRTDGQEMVESVANAFSPYPKIFQLALKLTERLTQLAEGDIAAVNQNFQSKGTDTLEKEWHYDLAQQQDFWQQLKEFFASLLLPTEITAENVVAASTLLHAQATQNLMQQACVDKNAVSVIGYHGQTLFHAPQRQLTLQVGNGQLLADILQIPVVAQFRQADVLAHGQGAPLAPLYHWALVQNDGLQPAAILNCGGIANITFVTHHDPAKMLAFDCGPGNVLLDRLVRSHTQQQQMFDIDGRFSMQGSVNENLLTELYQSALPQGFLQATPPKSLDSRDCQMPTNINNYSLEDACATLAAFTAQCMVDAVDFAETAPTRWILAGGGWHNPAILMQFKERLQKKLRTSVQIVTAKQAGWQQDALEAEAFAYLAKRSQLHLPLSYPGTTGVAQPTCGGTIYFPQG